MNAWIRAKTGDDPTLLLAGYALDGTEYADYADLAFTAPVRPHPRSSPAHKRVGQP
ncbi:MAG: hypothetical protein ACYCZY_01400 [Lacisediminihabitans sp.]